MSDQTNYRLCYVFGLPVNLEVLSVNSNIHYIAQRITELTEG